MFLLLVAATCLFTLSTFFTGPNQPTHLFHGSYQSAIEHSAAIEQLIRRRIKNSRASFYFPSVRKNGFSAKLFNE
jgi:hypothetical protein